MSIKRIARTMKLSATILLASATLAGCSDTTVGTKSFQESEVFTIPGVPLNIALPQITLDDIPWPINIADQPAYQDANFDFLTSIHVRDLVFEITPESSQLASDPNEDGSPDSFDFVSDLKFSLRATIDGTPTEVEIADLPMNDPQIASNATSLSMNVKDVDIRDLIENDPEIIISITGTPPPDNVIVKASIRFRVGVGIR